MSITVKNNIDPIDVKADLRAAIKLTKEPVSRKAMEQALRCMRAYDNAIRDYQDLNAKALGKIRELSKNN